MRYDVACPTCNADAGESCRTLISRHSTHVHSARQDDSTARTRALVNVGVGDLSVYRARRELRARNEQRYGARP